MTRKAIGEDLRRDHFHMTMHLTVPHPDGDDPPVVTFTTERHSNNHLVTTGPLFAAAFLDAPYPMPGIDITDYAYAVLAALTAAAESGALVIARGTAGKNLKETLMPLPPPVVDPLW